MDLYTYYRSTSSYRVRIALALKGLSYEVIPINLIKDGGEHRQADYRALNPQGRVPLLRTDEGALICQSPAILEYLEERYPEAPLLPTELLARARHRSIAAIIGCDVHPLHNVSVLNRLRQLQIQEQDVVAWIAHWIGEGLSAVEALIGEKQFCFGDVGLADVYLLPQVYAARRFNVELGQFPRICRVEREALAHPAFQQAHPDAQADKPA
ncbi:maleylacetoacetate isomerase [Pseudomonas duriflava]|uniref:Maleylacetoacetate isomerase n=1 Tax=Pseudomonas duriflava TaxID=459528 RepID=A0A562PXT8_9PSED|nr:maleylacetoacetate isomerase [Pseudomonas duriflava]TWI49261.1 maleylacetoacetate isomerase [Pseudomonas duriflava]